MTETSNAKFFHIVNKQNGWRTDIAADEWLAHDELFRSDWTAIELPDSVDLAQVTNEEEAPATEARDEPSAPAEPTE